MALASRDRGVLVLTPGVLNMCYRGEMWEGSKAPTPLREERQLAKTP